MTYPQALRVFEQIQAGDRIELEHEVKVGFRVWRTKTSGIVITKERRRHSLHYRRNHDDKVFSDVLLLQRDDGELTTVTLDEFSDLRIVTKKAAEGAGA